MDNPKTKSINEAVIDRMLKYMGERNLTQYRLAQLSNLPLSTVKSIMQRRTKGIELKTLIMLANGIGITPSEFINDKMFLAENLNLE